MDEVHETAEVTLNGHELGAAWKGVRRLRCRDAVRPGAVVLVHDGGGDRTNSIAAVRTVIGERLAEGWTFTLPSGGVAPTVTSLSSDFEDGLVAYARVSPKSPLPSILFARPPNLKAVEAQIGQWAPSERDKLFGHVYGMWVAGLLRLPSDERPW